MGTGDFDIFLSYSREDKAEVRTIKKLFESHGLDCFLDEVALQPGLPWMAALERALRTVRAVVVVLGRTGLSTWQRREVYLALDRQANEEKAGRTFPVIPLLLPGSVVLPNILFMNTWLDLREGTLDPNRIGVVLAAIRAEALPESRQGLADTCPYRGLRYFCEDDAPFYFGRETYSRRLLDVVKKLPVTAVIGPSGSGKSSLVYAGLLPLLRRERPPSDLWEAVSFTPGDQPYYRFAQAVLLFLEEDASETDRLVEARKLAAALANGDLLASDIVRRILAKSRETDRLLIICDQFEELLTLAPQDVRRPFVDTLLEMTQAPASLLITLRADFYGHVIELHRQLSDHLERGVVNLGPMTPDELRQTIVEPARRVQLDFEPGLVNRLLNDVGSEPGNLPLLEFALTELWARRQGRRLVTEAYESIGGVSGSIAERAETEFNKLGPQQQQVTRALMSRLVRVAAAAEGTLDSRQRVDLSKFEPNARTVISALASARLLVTGCLEGEGTETVEVAHEALVRHWHRLRDWLDQDREFFLWRQRLNSVITEWQATGRDSGSLLGGAVLVEAERWLSQKADELYPTEVGFIQASVARREQELARRRHRQRQLIAGLTLGLSVMAMIAAFAGLQWSAAERQRALAQEQRNVALSGELAMRASPLINEAFDRALLLSVEATNMMPTFSARSALYKALSAYPHLQTFLQGHVRTPPSGAQMVRRNALAFHPAGMMLAAIGGYHSDSVVVWKWRNGQPISESLQGLHGKPIGVGFSADGKVLAAADESGNLVVWNVSDRRRMYSLQTGLDLISVAFNPNGRIVATVAIKQSDRQVQLWDLHAGSAIGDPLKVEDAMGVAFSPDGETLAVAAGQKYILWNIVTGKTEEKKVEVKTNAFHEIAFSPNGRVVAAYGNRAIYLWDVASGRQIGEPLPNPAGNIGAFAFSPDGHLLASFIEDTSGTGILVHELGAPESKNLRLSYPAEYFDAVAFSPDSRYLAVYHADDAITLWSIAETRSLGEDLGPVGGEGDHYLYHTSDGRILVADTQVHGISVTESGKGTIFSAAGIDALSSGAGIDALDSDSELNYLLAPAVSRSGRWLAAAANGRLRLFDLHARAEQAVSGDFGEVVAVAFDPSEKTLAIGNKQGDILSYGLAAGATRGLPLKKHAAGISALKFSDNGATLASCDVNGEVRLWDMTTGLARPPLSGSPSNITGFTFSQANALLAAGGTEGFAIWNSRDGSLIKSYGTRSAIGAPILVSLAPEGELLATSNLMEDGIEIWDGRGAERLGPPLSFGEKGAAFALDFSPDARSLIAVQSDHIVRWDMDLNSWRTQACRIANRDLTADEWQRYLGDRPYHSTCSDMILRH